MKNADYYISKLKLEVHPEGGYYNESYRSNGIINKQALPGIYRGNRCYSTAIYFLLKSNEPSKFHKLSSDELWHFHDGSSVIIYIINKNGELTERKLGLDIEKGEYPQIIIPAETYFAAKVIKEKKYCLMSCTVAPGFEFDDFKLSKKDELLNKFPEHENIINELT